MRTSGESTISVDCFCNWLERPDPPLRVRYFEFQSGAFGFALGDVSGKGPPAALLAAEIQGVLAASTQSTDAPAQLVTCANRVLVRRPIQPRFATMSYGVLSRDGLLIYSNAGHNPAILVSARGTRRLAKGGLIVGVFADATYEEETVQLEPGDVLVLFSDGLSEALNSDGAEFGEERLLSLICANRHAEPQALLDSLLGAVHAFTGDVAPNDDMTALVLRYTGCSG